jgi:hypothetical protein
VSSAHPGYSPKSRGIIEPYDNLRENPYQAFAWPKRVYPNEYAKTRNPPGFPPKSSEQGQKNSGREQQQQGTTKGMKVFDALGIHEAIEWKE